MEIKNTEFFKNIKRLPPKGHRDFDALIDIETQKILNGVTVQGVYFSGWLYWHLNHWHIRIDKPDGSRPVALPILRDNEWIRAEALQRAQKEKKVYLEVGARQTAKALRDDQRLLTPTGYVPIGEAHPGLKIYDEQGQLTTITGVYPQGVRPVYKITLRDGRVVYADEDHRWLVFDRSTRKESVKTTGDILKDFRTGCKDEGNKRKSPYTYKYGIPNNKALEYPTKNLPMDPHLFGTRVPDTGIPQNYLYGSIEQRMALLQGLMDTGGTVSNTGTIYFSTPSPILKEQFCTLCRSLGIPVRAVVKKDRYKIILSTSLPVFRLGSKLNRIKGEAKSARYTTIVDIQRVEDATTTCIRVDNQSHLYLTEDFVVTHNSELEASWFGMNALMFENSQNVIVCGSDDDLTMMKDKVICGLDNMWEGFYIPRIDKTWRSNMIKLGYKTPEGNDSIWSYIVIRNANSGHNFKGVAGVTAKCIIYDEIGKYDFAPSYQTALPALKGRYGLRAIPILVGTGGSFDDGKSAERFFWNPEANDVLAFTDPVTNKKTGLFLSGIYQQEYKRPTTLGDWLNKNRNTNLPPDSELHKIYMEEADEELAIKTIEADRDRLRKSGDQVQYLLRVMYAPLNAEECFLTVQDNIYNIKAAQAQKARIIVSEVRPERVWLEQDGTRIVPTKTTKEPVSAYPTPKMESKDAPVIILEHPIKDAPHGLYTAGIDPMRFGSAEYSDSLGAVYIFKRMHTISSEMYQDMFVAWYVARTDDLNEWNEQARRLLKYYNATALCENDEMSFINYMLSKNEGHYLADQPTWIKELVPSSNVSRPKGIHRGPKQIRNFLNGVYKTYTEDVVHVDTDEYGNITREYTGMVKILDPVLLDETIKFNDEDNFDRLVAAQLAIAQARKMDPIHFITDKDIVDTSSKRTQKQRAKTLFINKAPLFTKQKKLFK